ncbi:hypothetical protein [Brenneria tiliae]|uniref:hypothetical protein n=1 Tax=Brenneria tiliae TaxID=2914984 RepID=UPI00201498F9|nr:hypothetical protein [Brenneria tiliae]MCL2897541.1 hypothetical protein [Brenneria tiliae]MCL2901892.1 hypothetical protein [Brenneria tiliae]
MSYMLEVKDKMEADHQLALQLERALQGVKEIAKEQVQVLNNGIERASWWSSCFFDSYQDVCDNLKHEDKRMVQAVIKMFKSNDIIFEMVKLYVDSILSNASLSTINKISQSLLKVSSSYASAKLTNNTVSYVVAKAACESFGFVFSVRQGLNKYLNGALMTLTGYGKVAHAASAANRLKSANPNYYHILYANNIEMLYFLVEPHFSNNAYFSKIMLSEDEVVSLVESLIR